MDFVNATELDIALFRYKGKSVHVGESLNNQVMRAAGATHRTIAPPVRAASLLVTELKLDDPDSLLK